MQRAGDPRALQRLRRRELLTGRDQAGHLMLGQPDLLAAELGQRQIGNLVVGLLGDCAHASLRASRWSDGVLWGARRSVGDRAQAQSLRPPPAAVRAFPARSAASRRRARPRGVEPGPAAIRGSPRATRRRLEPRRERDVRQGHVEARQQFLERAQPLQLGRSVQPVADVGTGGRHEPGLVDVAQHPGRPAGGPGSLVDRQRLHAAQPYHERVKVPPRRARRTPPARPARGGAAQEVSPGGA